MFWPGERQTQVDPVGCPMTERLAAEDKFTLHEKIEMKQRGFVCSCSFKRDDTHKLVLFLCLSFVFNGI